MIATPKQGGTHKALAWIPLALLLIAALWIRLPMLDGLGFGGDQSLFQQWAQVSIQHGLTAVYTTEVIVDHPPIDITLQSLSASLFVRFGGDLDTPVNHNPGLVAALKWPSLIFDVLLIAAGFLIARQISGLGWAILVGAALAFTPGLLADSVWWGQTDSIFGFFLVLTCYELSQRRAVSSWALYALTLMVKFQGIVLAPLILVLTPRRSILRGLAVFAVVIVLILGPFMLGSGILALRPYLASNLKYQYVTLDAHNFWFWIVSYRYDPSLGWDHLPRDDEFTVGPLSARSVGLLLVGGAALLIMLRVMLPGHLQPGDAFLLAAGLYAVFFTFSTQMHERYLYPAVVLLWMASARRRRLALLALGFSLTFSHNMLAVASRDYPLWQAIWPWLNWPDVLNAVANTLLTLILFGLCIAPLFQTLRANRGRLSASAA